MIDLTSVIIAIIASLGASTGFWAFIGRRREITNATAQLVMGLAHDRIVHLGLVYIDRGWVGRDEYDDLVHYLWKPYSKFGGNGLAEKIIADVGKLPIYSRARSIGMVKENLKLDITEILNGTED